MATSHQMLRSGAKSPARTSFMSSKSIPPRSILKRPKPLLLRMFNGASSPRAPEKPVQSPHVHFPPSPSLIALFSAHSPNTYDRAPITVSPNPLEIPAWGDRVYSPSVGTFKLQNNTLGVSSMFYPSPTVADFSDPRSPKNIIPFPSNQSYRKPHDLGKSLSSFPRSPYPSAPLSTPVDYESDSNEEGCDLKRRENGGTHLPTRSRSHDGRVRYQQVRRKVVQDLPEPPFTPIPSPLAQSLSPVDETAELCGHKPPPLDLDGEATLRQAFWQSMSLVDSEEENQSFQSPDVPLFRFGGRDGILWSPGLPRKSQIPKLTHSLVASPSPKDRPSYPSFSAALANQGDDIIAYPSRVFLPNHER